MLKVALLFISVCTYITLFGQNINISGLIGYENRVGFYHSRIDGIFPATPTIHQDLKPHLTGNAINLGFSINHKILNLSLEYSQSVRYDYLFDRVLYPDTISTMIAIGEVENRFIHDHHFSLNKKFKIENDLYWKIGIGYSFMNNNTRYFLNEYILTYNNDPVYYGEHHSFSFEAINFQTGITYKNLDFILKGYYFSKSNHSFVLPADFFLLSLGLNYKFKIK